MTTRSLRPRREDLAPAVGKRGVDLLDQLRKVGVVLAGDQLFFGAIILGRDAFQANPTDPDLKLMDVTIGIAIEKAVGSSANPRVDLAWSRDPLGLTQEALAGSLDRVLDLVC